MTRIDAARRIAVARHAALLVLALAAATSAPAAGFPCHRRGRHASLRRAVGQGEAAVRPRARHAARGDRAGRRLDQGPRCRRHDRLGREARAHRPAHARGPRPGGGRTRHPRRSRAASSFAPSRTCCSNWPSRRRAPARRRCRVGSASSIATARRATCGSRRYSGSRHARDGTWRAFGATAGRLPVRDAQRRPMSTSVAVVGAGAWGTALAAHLCAAGRPRRDALRARRRAGGDDRGAPRQRKISAGHRAAGFARRDLGRSRLCADAALVDRRDAGRGAARRGARARRGRRARAALLAVEGIRRGSRERGASGGRRARAPAPRADVGRAGGRDLGTELRRRGRARIADGGGGRRDRRRVGTPCRLAAARRNAARLRKRRHRRRRSRRRGEERARDRGRRERRPGLRPQRARRADHARARGDRPPCARRWAAGAKR